MKKFLAFSTALTFLVAPLFAQLQVNGPDFKDVMFVSDGVFDDLQATAAESPVVVVKYVGSEESGTLDINTNVFEFFSGALGSEVINGSSGFDVNTGDVCGTTNDSLDVTDAQCDTPAELVGVVNASGAPWRAVLVGALGSETLATAAEYIDPGDAQAKLPGGYGIRIDNSAVDTEAVLMVPWVGRALQSNLGAAYIFGSTGSGRDNIEPFLTRLTAASSYNQNYKGNPFAGKQAVLTSVSALVDSTSGWTLNVYAARYPGSSYTGAAATPSFNVTYRLVYTADGTDAVVLNADFSRAPLVSAPGETFLIQIVDDAVVTASISYSGFFLNQGN